MVRSEPRLSSGTRFFLIAAAILSAAFLGGGVLLDSRVFERSMEGERSRFLRDAEAAAQALSGIREEAPDGAADRIANLFSYQVTLMALDGRVVADTRVAEGDAVFLENHASRPEMATALAGETGLAERASATTGDLTLYVARPATFAGEPLILRLARPSGSIGEARAGAFRVLGGIWATALLLLWLAALLQTRRSQASAAELVRSIGAITDGEFDRNPDPVAHAHEFDDIARALRRMSEEMGDNLTELSRERDEMQGLIDSIAEGVVALTEDARVLRINRAAAELLEAGPATAFAPVGTLVRNPELREHLEKSVVHPLPPKEVTLGDRTLLVSAHHLPEGGSVVTFLDVTELRRMEKIRRDFVANASHELKTPLTAMRGFAETLLEGDPPESLRIEFLSSIRSNTIRLQNLVDDLLDLSRLESGGWTLQEEEVEVAGAADAVWKEVERQHRDRNVEFDVRGEGVVLADSQALHQIFLNLFSNAIRYTPDGGFIRVEIEPAGSKTRVSVQDSGAGIPSSALPRIFERFYRADPGRDRGAGGTGLGLAIVRHLIQSMGGEVGAESRLGRGTTIWFTLPPAE